MKRSVRTIRRALNRARIVFLALFVSCISAGLLFSVIEGDTLMRGQYWAVVTGFTVGFGDISPKSHLGMIMTMVYIPLMSLLWAFLIGHVAGAVIEDKNLYSHEEQERNEAAMLVLLKEKGLVPAEASEMPSVEWFQKTYGFQPDQA